MAKSNFIDIGLKSGGARVESYDPKKPYYPTISVGEIKGFEPETGDGVVLQGTVTRCVDDVNGGESYTIEITGVQCDCEGDLASAMDRIARKKVKYEDDDE